MKPSQALGCNEPLERRATELNAISAGLANRQRDSRTSNSGAS